VEQTSKLEPPPTQAKEITSPMIGQDLPAQKLKLLKSMEAEGLVTQEEYKRKREEILADF